MVLENAQKSVFKTICKRMMRDLGRRMFKMAL